jgi:hypothetical protein
MKTQGNNFALMAILLAIWMGSLSSTALAASVTLAAGTSQTNLPTENRWPGAQNPPYICCWGSQGQFVTFSFVTASGLTDFALRYSAGGGVATRQILLDGSVMNANQVFPATANWSTWTTLNLSSTLTSGAHTLTVMFDSVSGSSRYINLDNLTITQTVNPNVIPAGTSATNLPTESLWPGAQNPPYVCCWTSQGQFVTFVFNVTGGAKTLALRYSAGNGAASRKIELDGVELIANQFFPATTDWSSWSTVQLHQNLPSGQHSLNVEFDSSAGSVQDMHLDNLTLSDDATPPPNLSFALGYADSATGLTPWAGSANTIFIGEPVPLCCATHGPNNGGKGYDAGAIEITNLGSAPVTVNAVTVDFGGGSSPSHFDIWGGGTAGRLPLQLPSGNHLVLTMDSKFNFDTSDSFGEACHINTGVVGVVHVTVNGLTTDYQDDHQILNTDGVDTASCPGDIFEQIPFTTVSPGAQPPAVPVNDIAPSVTGVAIQSRILSGIAGAWNASPPPSLALQWLQCNITGANCIVIPGATAATYRPAAADIGWTLRLQVTASNASGQTIALSEPTASIAPGPTVGQLGNTSTGFTSTYNTRTTIVGSIFRASLSGTTQDFEFYARGARTDRIFTPKIYSVVNGSRGTLLATGSAVAVPKGTDGKWYVSTLNGFHLNAGRSYYLALVPSSTGSTYVGSETNGTLSVFVDYLP